MVVFLIPIAVVGYRYWEKKQKEVAAAASATKKGSDPAPADGTEDVAVNDSKIVYLQKETCLTISTFDDVEDVTETDVSEDGEDFPSLSDESSSSGTDDTEETQMHRLSSDGEEAEENSRCGVQKSHEKQRAVPSFRNDDSNKESSRELVRALHQEQNDCSFSYIMSSPGSYGTPLPQISYK
jgi:hypothetical protein